MAQKEIIGSGGCFPQYAKVLTTSGYKNISEIVIGDRVISYNDTGRLDVSVVEEIFFHKNNEVSKYTYWGGEIYATANHWVLNQLNSFSEIGDLSTHDCLIDLDGTLRPMIASQEVGIEDVYNLSVTPDHTYIVDGIRVHNGGGGKGGGRSRPAVEDPNTLRSKQFARVLDLVSEGEIKGLVAGDQSIYINNVPLQNENGTYNFRNSFVEARNGTQNQPIISDLNSVENTINVATRIERPKLVESESVTNGANGRLRLSLPNHGFVEDQSLYITPREGTLPENIYTVLTVNSPDEYTITVPIGDYRNNKLYVTPYGASLGQEIKIAEHAASALGITKLITKVDHGYVVGESLHIWTKSHTGSAIPFPASVYLVTSRTANTFTVALDKPEALNASTVFISRAIGITRLVSNLDADECYVTMEVPQLTDQNTSTGDLRGSRVSFVINVKDSTPNSLYKRVPLQFNTRSNGIFSGTRVTIITDGQYSIGTNSTIPNNVAEAVLNPIGGNNFGMGPSYSSYSMAGFANQTKLKELKGFSIYTEAEEASSSSLLLNWRTDNNKEQTVRIGVYKRLVGSPTWILHTTTEFKGANALIKINQNSFTPQTLSIPTYYSQTIIVDHPIGIYEYKAESIGVATGVFGFTKGSTSTTYDTVGVIEGKTLAKYQRGYTISLEGIGPWQVQVIRVEEESTKANISNELFWSTYTEVIKAKLNYPNSAMMYCAIDAEQFSSIPSRSYEIYGIKCKIPSNYNPLTREYTGFWDGTFVVDWTDNPAWVFYDLVTNTRYGLGDIVKEVLVDKWTLYSIAQYCDGSVPTGLGLSGVVTASISGTTLNITNAGSLNSIGIGSIITGFGIEEASITALGTGRGGVGTYTINKSQIAVEGSLVNIIIDDVEPRFTCNLYLQTREDAYRVVSNLASIFRGMVFWSTGLVTASQDSPKSVDAVYTAANVIDGTFTYTGTSAKTRHNVVLVSWNNPKNGYALEVEYVEDEVSIVDGQDGIIQTEISAMGCTSQGQAHRLGKWLLYTEQNETETVSFKTGLDGLLSQPGDVIQTQDPFRSGIRLGGRVSSVEYNPGLNVQITVDSPITFESGKTYTGIFTKEDGSLITLTLSNIRNNQEQTVLVANTSESITIPVGSIWVVSVSDLALQSWRVISVSEASKGTVEVTALSYNAEKFNAIEYNHRLQPKNIIKQSLIPLPVENITVKEHMYLLAPKVLSNILSISWEALDSSIDTFEVSYKNLSTSGNQTTLFTNIPYIEIPSITEDEYSISVQAVNALGTKSQITEIIHTVVGKTVSPPDILNFTANLGNDALTLSWSAIPDLDIDYYEVRYGSWGLNEEDRAIYRGQDTQVTLPRNAYVSGASHLFYIKARDTSGNWSASFTLNGVLIDNITARIIETQQPTPTILPQLVVNSVANVTNTIKLPNPATNAQLSLNGNILKISWSTPVVNSDNISIYGYRIYITVGGVESILAEVTSNSFEYLWLDNILTKSFRIETIDNSRQASLPDLSIVKTFTLPNPVTGVTSTFLGNKLILRWVAPFADSTDAPTKLYRVYIDSVFIAEVTGTTFEYIWVGTTLSRTFLIETVDILNNVSPRVSRVVAVVNPSAPTNLQNTLKGTTLTANWNHSIVASNGFPIAKYNIYFGDIGNPIKIDETVANSYSLEWNFGATTKAIHIEAVDINGNVSTSRTTLSTTVVPPNAPNSLFSVMKESSLLFSWNPATIALNSLPIEYYELREGGTSWNTSTFIANIPASANALQYLYAVSNTTELASTPVGTLRYNQPKVFRIASKDSFGLVSATQTTFSVTLTKPSAISGLSLNIFGQFINAAWNPIIPGKLLDVFTLPIDRYEIRATRNSEVSEDSWNNATSLASLSGSAIALDPPTNPSIDPANNADGAWYYLIRAYDSFNVPGALANNQLTITKPTIPYNLANKVIDNNVLLNWEDSLQHSFPIATFMLKKSLNPQATYTTADTVGTKSGNFTTVFEESSATFIYLLAAIDTAGNIGDVAHTVATVSQPPDYVLSSDIYRDDFNVTSYGSNTVSQTLNNIVKSKTIDSSGVSKIIGPMDNTQNFEAHFTSKSWQTPQNQITAGFPVYAQPSLTTGSLTEIIDYGIIFNTNQYVSVSTDISNITGTTGKYQIVLSTSPDGITYTSASSTEQLGTTFNLTFGTFAVGFRYVKVQIILSSNTAGVDLLSINSYRVKLSLKYTNDGASGSVSETGIYQINLLGGGSGYTSEPTVTIGGNGTGAKARAIISNGVVTSIEVINSGSGYTSIVPSNITITGGGGVGAEVSAIVKTSAVSGSIVAFSYDYLDVAGIQVTYGSTTPGIAIYDFVDSTYPKFFRVLLFSTSGTPILGNFSWSAKGTI